MRVLMSGGGTAGHVYPALTVAGRFVAEHDEVVFVGTPDGLEARLVPAEGIVFRGLPAAGFDRSRPWTLLTSSLRIALSTVTAYRWLASIKPDVVVGFGGYVSIPVGFAAVLRRLPLVLHEQNSVPGLANRVLARWARAVAITYEESAGHMAHPERTVLSGNPVRPAVLKAERTSARFSLGVDDGATVLLVFGGSRGARHLNAAIVALRDRLMSLENLVVVQIAGVTELPAVTEQLARAGGDADGRWRLVGYVDDMGSALAAADLVVSRAGATSIAEITAVGVPAFLVPYPFATDDHQTKNATAMVSHGAAETMADADIDGTRFGDVIVELLTDPARRASMAAASRMLGRRDAAEQVVRLVRLNTRASSASSRPASA